MLPTGEDVVTATLAYIDPGTGSLLLQMIVGGVAAGAVAAKLYWRRLKRLVGFRRAEDETPSD
jgi:hypothetical protein